MDEITIEELAVFLPYGLEIRHKELMPSDFPNLYLEGVDYLAQRNDCSELLVSNRSRGNDLYFLRTTLKDIKTIVRPMSKLFKPFQYAGEMINVGEMILEERNKRTFSKKDTKIALPHNPMQWEYWQIQIAAKYHFDIFGWLDKGLAIEKP